MLPSGRARTIGLCVKKRVCIYLGSLQKEKAAFVWKVTHNRNCVKGRFFRFGLETIWKL
ncbi:hypothetical protein D3C85_1919280 [compost metagenome]